MFTCKYPQPAAEIVGRIHVLQLPHDSVRMCSQQQKLPVESNHVLQLPHDSAQIHVQPAAKISRRIYPRIATAA
jgi:hypothetical protein